ncbi:NAD(P)/FAD-dependent oxidoreductase [Streptomyces candidus]|uniref:Assimilatory nitrate reductase electron transfer subunit n=1 Tax=Streptomyces candidus TaxID=67283 RepID=A0A7X0HJT7_9ACTN|nr:FAD-dependent oxidoreductase [Streptomyces candidus]MBB6438984.1 assimilatory nitrate reductase electron transfer subunit [Streptomyces candidus]GHH44500.1 nitrite reductase [Streptomyces candidus]
MTVRTRVAVVGAGMAAARLARQTLSPLLPGTLDLTLYGHEPHAPYNRALLAGVLDGRYVPEALALPTGGATVRTGTEVVAVDTGARTLRTDLGESVPYDTLVLATGANPVLPPIRGLHATDGHGSPGRELKDGVHAFRTLADCVRLAEAARHTRRAVVVGGGVLGVSAARSLAALGIPVEVVHQAPHLMERHLDDEAGATVRRALEGMGAAVYTGNRARAIEGDTAVTGVRLANGHVLDCDLVVLACGVRPRTGLARAAGIEVRRGIVVDDTLATSAPGVYAIGDCTEHRGAVHGLTGPGWAQADVLAARLSGTDPDATYTGVHGVARLTAGALEVAAFGEVADTDGDALRLADGTRGAYGSYKKLVMRGDRLVGAILVGDLAAVGELTRTYERGEPLPSRPLDLFSPLEGAVL